MVDMAPPDGYATCQNETVALPCQEKQAPAEALDEPPERAGLGLGRAISIFSAWQQALARATDEQALLQEVCRIIVVVGGYPFAWVGVVECDPVPTVRPIAHMGNEDSSRADLATLATEPGRSPTALAIHSGKPYVVRTNATCTTDAACCRTAVPPGYAAALALPLALEYEQAFAVLTVYAYAPQSFDPLEERLLTQLANSLTYGIHTLRERAERQRSLDALQAAYTTLAERVQQRTASLIQLNRALQSAITERKQLEAAYRTLVEYSVQGISVFQSGHIVFANPAAAVLTGYSVAELLGMTPERAAALIHPEDRDLLLVREHNYEISQATPEHFAFRIRRRDGNIRWLEAFATRSIYQGQPAMHLAYVDITEARENEQAMRQANEQLTVWVNELQWHNRDLKVLNTLKDFLQRCKSFTEMCAVMADFGRKLFPGQSGAVYLLVAPGQLARATVWGNTPLDTQHVPAKMCWALRHKQAHLVADPQTGVCCRCSLAGYPHTTAFPYLCVPIYSKGNIVGILHVRHTSPHTDAWIEHWHRLAVTVAEQFGLELANLQLRRRLHEQAIHDPLTGLFNRHYLSETLQRELQQNQPHPVGIIILDIDHFKKFNDTYGHDGGDTLLRAIGTLLRENIRGEDIPCRYGGEEFVLILPGASLKDTQMRAEQIRQRVKQLSVSHAGQPLPPITISLGVACFPAHGATAARVIKAADEALYRAKAAGRNCVMVAQSSPVTARLIEFEEPL